MFFGKELEMGSIYRSLGGQRAERYGVGFMDKTGVTLDMDHGSHPAYVMVLVLRGQGDYMSEKGKHYQLGPGSCFQRFPGKPHTVTIDPDSHWVECFLEIGDSMVGLLRACTGMSLGRPVMEVSVTEGLVEQFITLRNHFRKESDMKLVRLLPAFLQLAQTLHGNGEMAAEDELDTLLEEACDYLTADFQVPVDFPGFCRQHGWGYENFRKVFKERLGVSPHRYRIRRRLDTACALLSHPDMTVKALAACLGYSSPYEFSEQFKRYIGCPPSAYVPRRRGI